MEKMTNVIDSYKNGNNMGDALVLFTKNYPQHELASVTLLVYNTIINPQYFEESIIEINKLDYSTFDIEDQLIFLELLFWLYSSVVGRQNNATSIISILKSIISDDLPIEFQILPTSLDGILKSNEGDQNSLTVAYEHGLEILKGKSNRYKKILWDYLIHLCNINSFDKIEKNLHLLKEEYDRTPIPRRYDYVLLLNDFAKSKWTTIEATIQHINEDNNLKRFYKPSLDAKLKLSQIMITYDENILNKNEPYDWSLYSYLYLARKNPSEALKWARKYAEKHINFKSFSSFDSYCLLRSELANENANAAEFFLENKHKIGNESILDDFFKFRIHRIKGNFGLAQDYFNSFLHHVKKYDLYERFDTELLLSPELSIKDLRSFMKNFNADKLTQNAEMRSQTSPRSIVKNKGDEDLEIMSFMIGKHSSILEVKALIKKLSSVDLSVLITGETGTGKDLVAKALWQAGPFKNKKFIPINCGAISDHLLQSELFGHKKGAFTGAVQDHKGVFEEAQGGIVFLDEIGEISPKMQVSLLRILETGEYRAIGGTETKNLKCKIVFATNRSLADLVEKGLFRQDLQFRLERLIINLPPLRDRSMDIPLLVDHFLNRQNPNLPPISMEPAALEHLSILPWEGNIRELRNEMERMRLFHSDKKVIGISDLSDKYKILKKPIIKKVLDPKSKENIMDDKALNLKSKFRKLDELKCLFENYQKLSRTETAKLLKVSLNTAANYLNSLEEEGFIVRITPTNSVKTHYFEVINSKKGNS